VSCKDCKYKAKSIVILKGTVRKVPTAALILYKEHKQKSKTNKIGYI
jgi:hypothetical protein